MDNLRANDSTSARPFPKSILIFVSMLLKLNSINHHIWKAQRHFDAMWIIYCQFLTLYIKFRWLREYIRYTLFYFKMLPYELLIRINNSNIPIYMWGACRWSIFYIFFFYHSKMNLWLINFDKLLVSMPIEQLLKIFIKMSTSLERE